MKGVDLHLLLARRAHLEASLKREVNDTTERDALIERTNQQAQAREDAQRAAADAARARLQREVTESQEAQMRQRILARQFSGVDQGIL